MSFKKQMPGLIIKAEGLSKKYSLKPIGTGTLRDDLNRWWAGIRGKEDPLSKVDEDISMKEGKKEFWALSNVCFEIKQGEAVGIIGKNGAGKSTLLKILSRITTPSSGEIKIGGRIASLLEVGTGFHPELTGKENIYLNGAIMGMSRREISSKLEEIISFAGVEKYVDTPVKRYSTGMYVRLAFAVAAHLDPDILIIDEVLAVGDAEFQKKCMGKMNQVMREGRTLLFVSHNLAAVRNLCTRCILLHNGKILKDGSTATAIQQYNEMNFGNSAAEANWELNEAPGTTEVRITSVRVTNTLRKPSGFIEDNEDFFVEIDFICHRDGLYLTPNIQLFDSNGILVLSTGNWSSVTAGKDPYSNQVYLKGFYSSFLKFPAFLLNEGSYTVSALINKDVSSVEVYIQEAVSFTVVDSGAMKKEYMEILGGVVRPRLEWKTMAV
jgi:lipopolysaccharide transport system ATP-binding protein